MSAINLLVVGQCGDGKSTLIDGLRDKTKSEKPPSGKSPQGVTKEAMVYPCPDLDGVAPVDLASKIEQVLQQESLSGGIRGVLVTTPVDAGRIGLGAQVVQAIVDKGFLAPAGGDKFAIVILVGTKMDRADKDDKDSFLHGTGVAPSVRDAFFAKSSASNKLCVMVSHHDYSPLLQAVRKLPAVVVRYQKPTESVMSEALAETIGASVKDLEAELEANRRKVAEAKQKAEEEKRRRQREHQEQVERLKEAQMKLEEQRRREQEEHERHEREMERIRREQEEERRRERERAAERLKELERERQRAREAAARPQGYQGDSGHYWCAIAQTPWGRIPGKAMGGTCWYAHGGKEHTTENFQVIRGQDIGARGNAQGHQTDGHGDLWCAIARTHWGNIPGKAKNGTCSYSSMFPECEAVQRLELYRQPRLLKTCTSLRARGAAKVRSSSCQVACGFVLNRVPPILWFLFGFTCKNLPASRACQQYF